MANKCFFLCLFLLGMEVAAYLSDKASSVTVIGSSKFPFQSSLGPDIGKMTMQVSRCCCIFLIVGLLLLTSCNNNHLCVTDAGRKECEVLLV